MIFSRWPVLRLFLALSVAGLGYQLLPSRLGNERMVDDFVQIAEHLMAGEREAALGAIRRGYAPFLPASQEQSVAHTRQPSTRSTFSRQVRITAGQGGHFQAHVRVNGHAAPFIIDTGASLVAIRHEDALRLGLKVAPADFTGTVRTANGTARVAPVTIDRMEIKDIELRNVRGVVSEPGALGVNLLGMSFLGRLSDVRFNQREILLME